LTVRADSGGPPTAALTPENGAPLLSVLLATRRPWPFARASLERIVDDARAVDAEVVVALGDARARPPDGDPRYARVVWLEGSSGASVFALRALALGHVRGRLVAITEDHALIVPGWCARVIASHAAHPDAVAIGGVVDNGARSTAVDWASFFIANGPFAPPLSPGTPRISLQANVSYKRAALAGAASTDALGLVQHDVNHQLAAGGGTLIADEQLVVVHDQHLSWREHSAGHFHNGRTIAASRLPRLGRRRALYAVGALGLPPVMLLRTLRAVLGKRRYTRPLLAGLPAMCWLLLCHAAGELAGYVAGPGGSPERVA
jgi:hypothetical protein